MKVPVLVLDSPNANHRIYPKEVVQKALDKYRKEFIEQKRALIVKRLPETSTIDLRDVIGTVKDATIEEGKIMMDVEFLPGMADAMAANIGIANGKFSLRTSGMGTMKKDKDGNDVVQEDYELISVFVTDNPA